MQAMSITGALMRRSSESPLFLLILTGALLGSMLPMSRVAVAAGSSPLAFAFWPALGSGILLTAIGLRSTRLQAGRLPQLLGYSIVGGVLSVAVPNSITFFVMPELGTSLTSLVYTLPPLFTYAFAWLVGVERYSATRIGGVLLGLTGAIMLAPGANAGVSDASWWLALALCAPVSIAAGNIYRKLRLPQGVPAALLAGGMLLGGAAALLPPLLLSPGFLPASPSEWQMLALQAAFTSAGYVAYFRLQKVADPVYFSQLGYAMSATGVVSGVVLFDEQLAMLSVVATGVIACSIAIINSKRGAAA